MKRRKKYQGKKPTISPMLLLTTIDTSQQVMLGIRVLGMIDALKRGSLEHSDLEELAERLLTTVEAAQYQKRVDIVEKGTEALRIAATLSDRYTQKGRLIATGDEAKRLGEIVDELHEWVCSVPQIALLKGQLKASAAVMAMKN